MRVTYTIAIELLQWLRRLQQQKAASDMSAAGYTKVGKKICAEDSYGGRDVYGTVLSGMWVPSMFRRNTLLPSSVHKQNSVLTLH